MYLTYSEYTTMGGTITDTKLFDRACFRAQAEIDRRTFKRLANEVTYSDAVKRCMFELIETIAGSMTTYETAGGAVASHSNDGVSETYVTASASDWINNVMPAKIAYIVDTYLSEEHNSDKINVLYRGVK